MVRALTVFCAAAWLALAPAAFAASEPKKPAHKTAAHATAAKASTHRTSSKAKAAEGEAPSKRAKLRRAGEDAPAAKHKSHGVATEQASAKTSKASRTHRKGATDEDEVATTHTHTAKGKKGRAAAGEDVEKTSAPAKPCKKVHGKAVKCKPKAEAGDSEVAAAEPKASRRHGKATEPVDEEPVHATHHYPVVETPTIRRAEEREEGACAAARDAKGRHRRSAKARAAAYRTCVARAHAAARRAAEEEAARVASWTPIKGPILYTGPVAHSATAPTPYATPTAAASADPGAPGGANATPGAGAATVAVPPASRPAGGGGFLGLFQRKPERPSGPAPTLAGLLGADETRLRAELGDPDLMRAEGGGALWTYKFQTCAVYVFLSRPLPSAPWQVKGAQAGPLKRGQATPDLDGCLKAGRP
jgi:hypothetical protein